MTNMPQRVDDRRPLHPGAPHDKALEAVCRTAADLLGLPVALIALAGEAAMSIKAWHGAVTVDSVDKSDICKHALAPEAGEVLVISDLLTDERFRADPVLLVGKAVRFYAGVPLALQPGSKIGVLCVLDTVPHPDFTDRQRQQLRELADLAEIYLGLENTRRTCEAELKDKRRIVGRVNDQAARESERCFRLLAENTTDVVIWSDLDTTRKYVSPAARTVLGYEPQDLIGTRPLDSVHSEDAEGYRQVLDDLTSGRVEQALTCQRYRRKDGTWIWLEIIFSLTRDAETGRPDGYVASLRDITRRKEAEQQVAHMAVHDALTGLPNRTLFHDRLAREITRLERQESSFAVLACDLDGFKAINDALGHPAGDTLLRAVAERLTASVRDTDTVARLGGDEFALILSGLDHPQSASLAARRVIEAISQPFDLDGRSVAVGISVGISLGRHGSGDADGLFKSADIALYRAKASGRNTFRFYEPGMDAAIAARTGLELDMREALQGGGFVLHYQPIVEAASGAVGGFEALLRWPHANRGMISPGEFIPLAEETGLIIPLGAWVLREACREAANWPGELRVAVNVSALQLQQAGLEESVTQALAASGLAPRRLELEITESVLIQDSEAALACLHRLRALGVRIALDDFGTGYSSLSYLRRFPFDKIKIDRSFVQEIGDPDTAAIVRAIVSIGERLRTAITAEGVETCEQLERVRREGCTEVQGFLYSRPLPARDALGLLEKLIDTAA